MLFRKDIEASCSYCRFGNLVDEETVTCLKKGLSAPWESCRKFAYDPLKRKPAAPVKLKTSGFSEKDFEL